MAKPNRPLALLAYVLPLIGPLLIIGVQRRSVFAVYHACQSLALLLGVIIVPLLWAVQGWVAAWVPLVGPVYTMSSFSLVIAAWVMVAAGWLMGIGNALAGRANPLLLFGGWGERIFNRLMAAIPATPLVETAQPASHP